MRTKQWLALACSVSAALAGPIRAEPDVARQIIERAVRVMGRGKKNSTYRALSVRGAGTFYVTGRPIPCTLRFVYQPPGQFILAVEGEAFRMSTVVNGEHGWVKLNDLATPIGRARLAECKENLYLEKVVCLLPMLKDSAFSFRLLPEMYVNEAPAVGVKVIHKGRRDVKLYFDRASGLLVKMEGTVREHRALLNQETIYSDYARVGDGLRPRQVTIRRDGKPYAAWRMTEQTLHEEKLRDVEFSKP